MSGSLYVVLFRNGTAKVGKSKNVSQRVNQHVKSGASLGIDVLWIYITHPIDGVDSAEKDLIRAFSVSHDLEAVGREYFSNADEKTVEAAILRLGFNFIKCRSVSVKKVGDERFLVASLFSVNSGDVKAYPRVRQTLTPVSERIHQTIIRAGGKMSLGVIYNRLRHCDQQDIDEALVRLKKDGVLDVSYIKHPTNGKTATHWSLK